MFHKELWKKLDGLGKRETARRAKCKYFNEPDRYIIILLSKEYEVITERRDIFCKGDSNRPADFIEQLVILAYLIGARDIPLGGKLVKPEALPEGEFFFRGPHAIDTCKLKKVFGECPERLFGAAKRFNGERCEFGDASVRLFILPRVPVTAVIWKGDEEFEARVSVLFDQTAACHMLLDALLAAVNRMIEALVEQSENHE
jgi:hypothetical protein